ncbi:MAG: DNA translocase FtsK 4TM domain-containing protein, partial [Gammaproteobacteria bacterium]|nr:DNA translocase FtsK 4TM domain-containing protein [Gammaproteobacteria bacterium]
MSTPSVPLREIGLIGLSAGALFVLLAIASYSPSDPSFSFSGNGGEVQNLVGKSGAWFADLMLYLLGLVAYVLPLALVVVGVRLVLAASTQFSWGLASVRGLGWLGLIVSSCILMQLHYQVSFVLPAGVGGVLGQWLGSLGLPVFGLVGLTLLSLTGVLIGAQAAAGFSWLAVAEFTGRHLHAFLATVVDWLDRRITHFKSRRAAKATIRDHKRSRRQSLQVEKDKRGKRLQPEIKAPEKTPVSAARQQKLFDLKSSSELPDLDLLDDRLPEDHLGFSEDSLEAMSRLLEIKLQDFGVEAEVVSVLPGPVITRFELQPAPGVKVQKITSLVKDLARSLAVISVRVVEVIPGKSVVGIEIPNEHRETVRLKDILGSQLFQDSKSPVTLALGKDIAGAPVTVDVTKMPHLLVAGTTGSGKSVGVNAMLLSILCKATPDQVRLILVDPKMLELSVYEGIPHLLTPVVTDMKE